MGVVTNAKMQTDPATWHAISADEVVKRLTTNGENGLEAAEASTRLGIHGPNLLPEGKKRGPFMRLLAQFNNVLVFVLLAAGFTKLMLNLWVDAAIIFGVVVLNALLGFVQEGKAEKALDSIRNMLSAEARTVRDGETRLIPAEQLVPGDLVLLESGDKVPADLRLIDAKNLFRCSRRARKLRAIRAHIRHLVVDNQMVLGVDSRLHVVAHDPRTAPARRHRARVRIGQRDLFVRRRQHLLLNRL